MSFPVSPPRHYCQVSSGGSQQLWPRLAVSVFWSSGAPHLPEVHTSVPELFSHQFAVAVTVTSFLFWTLLGSLTGLTFGKFSGR